jgi:hypothetical protein
MNASHHRGAEEVNLITLRPRPFELYSTGFKPAVAVKAKAIVGQVEHPRPVNGNPSGFRHRARSVARNVEVNPISQVRAYQTAYQGSKLRPLNVSGLPRSSRT